jgi:hypothetical protein
VRAENRADGEGEQRHEQELAAQAGHDRAGVAQHQSEVAERQVSPMLNMISISPTGTQTVLTKAMNSSLTPKFLPRSR